MNKAAQIEGAPELTPATLEALGVVPGKLMLPDGVYPDISHEDYLTIDAFSASGAKKLLRSPAHFLVDRTMHHPPTDEMIFGTAVHMGIFEPERFAQVVGQIPADAPKRPTSAMLRAKKPAPASVEAIDWWREFDQQSAGKLLFDAADTVHIHRTIEAIKRHPGARILLEDLQPDVGQRELSMLWTDPTFHVQCKLRTDYLRSDFALVDLKTAADASPGNFPRDAAKYMYHLQAAHYVEGVEICTGHSPKFYALIVAEKEPPYAVAAYTMPDNAIHAGMRLKAEALIAYQLALESGEFPGYPDKILPLAFPKWATTFFTPTY